MSKNKSTPSKTDEDLRRERERLARDSDAYGLTTNDYVVEIIAAVNLVTGEKPAAQRKYLIQVAALALSAVEKSYNDGKTGTASDAIAAACFPADEPTK